MKPILVFPLLLLLAAPLGAQTAAITVTSADCRNVVAHTPDASVAYTPGVAVDGRRVAPADLPGSGARIKAPESFSIRIGIDLLEDIGVPAGTELYKGEVDLGIVEYKDGRLTYNGQELNDGAQNAIAKACRKLQQR